MEIKLGVRGHDLASNVEPEEFAKIIHDYGFSYLQLVMNKALKNPVYNEKYASRVKKALDQYGITVAMLGAYFNPVHSDKAVVEKGVVTFEKSSSLLYRDLIPSSSSPFSFISKTGTRRPWLRLGSTSIATPSTTASSISKSRQATTYPCVPRACLSICS